mmetsp:Transcript_13871/g.32323  ORF Transcript_13871/g.32323 Transcript_13871/m.32323 type:complete len:236 (-) Transcript_13871:212-919(-)
MMMIQMSSSRRSTAILTFLAILSYITISFVQNVDAAYVVSIEAKDEQCFVIASPGAAGGTLDGSYLYLSDSLTAEPLSVVVIDLEKGHVLHRSRRHATDGKFRISLKPDQKVNFCLQNGIVTAGRGNKRVSTREHDGEDRVVSFSYDVEVKNENSDIHSQNDKNQKIANELDRAIKNLVNHHQGMRVRESMHREVVESTFGQLFLWLVVECIAVTAIAGIQILYFRRFLERRRYI